MFGWWGKMCGVCVCAFLKCFFLKYIRKNVSWFCLIHTTIIASKDVLLDIKLLRCKTALLF